MEYPIVTVMLSIAVLVLAFDYVRIMHGLVKSDRMVRETIAKIEANIKAQEINAARMTEVIRKAETEQDGEISFKKKYTYRPSTKPQ
jgi:hypothetical protein